MLDNLIHCRGKDQVGLNGDAIKKQWTKHNIRKQGKTKTKVTL